jgi:hypothetical protein
MASVTLPAVLLSDAADLSAPIELDVMALQETGGRAGDVRTYASGRRRAVVRAGKALTLPLEFDVVDDRPLLDLIRSWEGRLLLYRDPRGRKHWCSFYGLSIEENVAVDVASVSLTLVEVTHDESV